MTGVLITRLVVHFDIAATSQNRRQHWSKLGAANRKAKRAAWEAWALAGRPRADGPVDVRLISCRSRTMDEGNFVGACKGVVDGLFTGCITPDDAPYWVRFLPVEQRPHKSHRHDPTVIVEVFERISDAAPC